jgi:hypothetical protein
MRAVRWEIHNEPSLLDDLLRDILGAPEKAHLPFPWWPPTSKEPRAPTPEEVANGTPLSDGITTAIVTGTDEAPQYQYLSFTWLDTFGDRHTVTLGDIQLALVLLHKWVDHAWLCVVHLPSSRYQCRHEDCQTPCKLYLDLTNNAVEILTYRRSIYGESLIAQVKTNARRFQRALQLHYRVARRGRPLWRHRRQRQGLVELAGRAVL